MIENLAQYNKASEQLMRTLHPRLFTIDELLAHHEGIRLLDRNTESRLRNKLMLFPEHPAPYFWLGLSCTAAGRYREAEDLLDLAINKNRGRLAWQPEWAQTRLYFEMGDSERGRQAVTHLAKKYPEVPFIQNLFFSIP